MSTRVDVDDQHRVDVEFDGTDASASVHLEYTDEETVVRVGDVRLRVTGRAGGYQALLAFRDMVIWSGDYTEGSPSQSSKEPHA